MEIYILPYLENQKQQQKVKKKKSHIGRVTGS